jgi:hypothetical protein
LSTTGKWSTFEPEMKFRKNRHHHPLASLAILGLTVACGSESGDGLQAPDGVEHPSVNEAEVDKTCGPLDFELRGQALTELSVTDMGGGRVQFRVRSTSPFLAGGLDPLIRIGDTIISDYTYEELNTVLVYTADLAALPERGLVLFGWGLGSISEGMTTDCSFSKETRSFRTVDS